LVTLGKDNEMASGLLHCLPLGKLKGKGAKIDGLDEHVVGASSKDERVFDA
jgi:hypothetical protein